MAAALLLAGSALAGNAEINTAGATGIAIDGCDCPFHQGGNMRHLS